MALRNFAKRCYGKLKKIPVVGALAAMAAPAVNAMLKSGARRGVSRNDLINAIEMQSSALQSLKASCINEAEKAGQARKELRETLYAFKNRLEFVRLEIFAEVHKNRTYAESAMESKIINTEKHDSALAADSVKLNIGCGHKPAEGYINVDSRDLPHVDVVADASNLPYPDGGVREIFCSHLLEHFTESYLCGVLLPAWYGKLAPRGQLRIIVPDTEAMIAAYTASSMPFSDLKNVLFGEQDYEEDYHYTMFSKASLKKFLLEAGFAHVEFVDENRQNGKCREMELIAYKTSFATTP